MDRKRAGITIKECIPALLDEWDAQVRASIPVATHFNPQVLTFYFPRLLQELAEALESPLGGEPSTTTAAVDHGRLRTGMAYTLDPIFEELRILQHLVMKTIATPDRETRSLIDQFFFNTLKEVSKEHCRVVLEAKQVDENVLETLLDQARCILLSAEVERVDGEDGSHLIWIPLRFDISTPNKVIPIDAAPGESFFETWQRVRTPRLNEAYHHAEQRKEFEDGAVYSEVFHVIDREGKDQWLQEDVSVQSIAPKRWRIVGTIFNVTERKKIEEELREAGRQKDLFLAMLSHELRNPMTPIRNAVYILKMKGLSDPGLNRASEIIDRQVTHMARLVDDLLDASRITRAKIQLQKTPVNLADLIAASIENMQTCLNEKRQRLTVRFPSESLLVEADPTRLEQVFGNLLNNACKYTPDEGEIEVTAERDGGVAVVRVKDTGEGIEPEILPQVFDLFTQADRSLDRAQGGLGIGLSIVKGLVEQHGGSVSAHSDGAGQGSAFTLRLPLLIEEVQGAEIVTEAGEIAPTPCRILLVEDNRDAAETLKSLLEMSGHEIRAVYTGPDALVAADEYQPEVVLLDIGLPGMNGYDVAARLREIPSMKASLLIALTGYGQEEDHQRSREVGIDHHLLKPMDFDRLRQLLSEKD